MTTAFIPKNRLRTDVAVSLGLTIVVTFFAISGFLAYRNTAILSRNNAAIVETHSVILALNDLLSYVKDAESGQRGYIITGDDAYLEPYNNALTVLNARIRDVERIVRERADLKENIELMKSRIEAKLAELKATIDLRRTQGFEVARDLVQTDQGKKDMDLLRDDIAQLQVKEQEIRLGRLEEMKVASRAALVSGLLTGALGILLSCIVGYLIRRATLLRQRQDWIQSGQVGLAKAIFGEQRLEQLGENILKFLAQYLDAHAGALFVRNGGVYQRISTYGVSNLEAVPARFEAGQGLLGEAAREGRTVLIRDVPTGYLQVSSGLGTGSPRHLVIATAAADGLTNTVLELGFIHPLTDQTLDLLNEVDEAIGASIKAAHYRENLQRLLEETQRQAEELQAQGEELRVSNEELEEQSRSLKESQVRLEQQQAELEQTNSQLEEQTQQLELQRDDLALAKEAVQQKAHELERASQYKSDFLANMSHELRTPLNSSLILAKLLSDNPLGNLTEEQVKFSQTILSSGNYLLGLINDILDLSKIEAGHMEIRPENVRLDRLTAELKRSFEPLTAQKQLAFKITRADELPDTILTDRQRLEQILKNLLSNAIKFTEKGEIELTLRKAGANEIAFAVRDTGIGIPDDKRDIIFEAFRQADSAISRRFGGTGLGLSISRELTRLLGGRISLESELSVGSTFTVTLPVTYNSENVMSYQPLPAPHAKKDETLRQQADAAETAKTPTYRYRQLEDDRDVLGGGRRTILVVEDDESFARILYDLAHEQGFKCLLATTAAEAITCATQYLPNAVVLDVGLPDNSGLSVLDRLKHDARTRHIPVHVISASDYSQTAMSLGAVGYMLKPVKREELVEALKNFETRLEQQMRHVLIVEDDPVQQDSMKRLLATQDVETSAVGTAAECLQQLKEKTFDCMVLDLSLPDASGYALLETLSREDAYSFPPVIVYTGRDLSIDEEQRLRRYSKSIIIKGAKSPERLLDEVTLFLHQVVSDLPPEQQRLLEKARNRDAVLEGRRILIVEDDVANIYALSSILEPRGALVQIARNGREALEILERTRGRGEMNIDLVLMDVMMPEMDGLTATRRIRQQSEWKKLPIIMLTAKAMRDDQEQCLDAGANDYMAKPLDVEKLLSLVRVWMPR